ncbi:translation initiation factor IF-3 [Candidatus Uhrbacteria bacterium]|nr:translation initiation factor IF-3 [Candidatus Uhrbacteria bacterium]
MRIHRHRRFKRQLEIERQTFRANERIRIPEVRVVDEQGENLGAMATAQAITLARERGLDLVEVAPKAQPPVCRFIDFKQFRYEQEKIRRQQKTRAKKVEVKGVRLSLRIGEHDRQLRLRQAKGFFDEGNRVAVEIILRGRERQYGNLAREVIMKFVDDLKLEYEITIDQPLSVQGGRFSLVLGGKKHGAPDTESTDEDEELDLDDEKEEEETEE